MTIDWALVQRVRDQRRARSERCLAEQRAADAAACTQARAARLAWLERCNARDRLASDLAVSPEAMNVARLREAGLYAQSLGAGLAQAALALRLAEEAAAAEARLLQDRQRALRRALGALTAVEHMQAQASARRRQDQDSREAERAEESARQRWLAARPRD